MYGRARIVNDECITLKFSSLLDMLGNNCNVMSVRSCLVHVSECFLEVATLETSDTLVESRLP